MSHDSNAANDAAEARSERNRSTWTGRQERHGENVPDESELRDRD